MMPTRDMVNKVIWRELYLNSHTVDTERIVHEEPADEARGFLFRLIK